MQRDHKGLLRKACTRGRNCRWIYHTPVPRAVLRTRAAKALDDEKCRQAVRTHEQDIQTTRAPHPRHTQDKKCALSMPSKPSSFAIRHRRKLRPPQAPRPSPRISAASRKVEQRRSGAGEHRKQHGSKQEHPCPCPPCFLRPAEPCQHPAHGGAHTLHVPARKEEIDAEI